MGTGAPPRVTEPAAVPVSKEAARAAVYGAVADLNQSLPEDHRLSLDGTYRIFSALDSLAALNFLLRIEQRLSDASGVPCDLMDGDLYERVVFQGPTLDELVDGIHATLSGEAA